MKEQPNERWWVVPVAAMGLAFTAGFIALVYAHEASDPGEGGEGPAPEPTATPDPPAAPAEKKRKKDRWWLIPLLAVALALLVNRFLLVNAHVPSGSMEPAIPAGALLIGDRTAYLRGEPQTGDVALFHHPEFGDNVLVKRIIALPGQTFSMEKGRVYIDGQLLDEEYLSEFSADSYPETVVPEGCYLVLGDHRINSNDSRFWADPFVRREDLLARALLVYFPRPHLL